MTHHTFDLILIAVLLVSLFAGVMSRPSMLLQLRKAKFEAEQAERRYRSSIQTRAMLREALREARKEIQSLQDRIDFMRMVEDGSANAADRIDHDSACTDQDCDGCGALYEAEQQGRTNAALLQKFSDLNHIAQREGFQDAWAAVNHHRLKRMGEEASAKIVANVDKPA